MVRLVEMIATRDGIGDVLANGSRKAADILGKGHEFLITSRARRRPPTCPRPSGRWASSTRSTRSARTTSRPSTTRWSRRVPADLYMGRLELLGFDEVQALDSLGPDKVRFALRTQQFYSFLDTASLCQFVWGPAWSLFGPQETVDFVRAVTGWEDFDLEELMAIGERRLNMLRAFNVREGLDRKDDKLPAKFFKPLTGTGPTRGVALDHAVIEGALDEYYRLAGWDVATGNPTPDTLARLGLAWVP